MHGYKAHLAADKDTGLIRAGETTPAKAADVPVAPMILPDEPGEVYGDRAYDALSVEVAIVAKGGTAKLRRKGLPASSKRTTVRCHSGKDRENFWHLEAPLSFSCAALWRPCESKTPSPLAAIVYNIKRLWRLEWSDWGQNRTSLPPCPVARLPPR